MRLKPYSCADLAERLGVTPDHFRRTLPRYIADGLPAPLPGMGHKRWDRARADAWLRRQTLPQPANDAVELEPAPTDDDHRARLHACYGRFGLTGS